MKKPVLSIIEYIGFRLFTCLFRILPFCLCKRLFVAIFIFGGMVLGVRKKVAYANLSEVYEDKSKKEINTILKNMYTEMGKTAAETYCTDMDKLFDQVSVEGWDNLQKAVEMGRGVILATGHLGNWELAGRYISKHFKTAVVIRKQRNRLFNDYTNKLREKYDIKLIYTKNALKEMVKAFGEGYIVCLLMDQNAGKRGVLTDFLGRPASTFVGPAKIAIKYNIPIVPAAAIRTAEGRHLLYFDKIISAEGYDKSLTGVTALTQRISNQIEKYIHRYPQQWFWVHRRWRKYHRAREVAEI
jgi:KDO2-lipid IV(A) lauroyltransferase